MSAGKILVVDDDPQIRRVMKATLVGHGYEVTEARTGEEALEGLSVEMPNLVLLDMNMPGMGGIQTCRLIRSGSEIAIIMLTVSNSERDKVDALDAGADDYITKPFSTPELLARIRATLRRLPHAPDHGELKELDHRGVVESHGRIRETLGEPRLAAPWTEAGGDGDDASGRGHPRPANGTWRRRRPVYRRPRSALV